VYPISRGVILSEAEPKDLLSGAGAKQILRFAQDDTSQSPPDTLILNPV
jgi:hypothetical protein